MYFSLTTKKSCLWHFGLLPISPSRWSAVCECTGSPWRHTLATRHLPVFTCLHLFLPSPPEVSVLLMLMGIALYSFYKMSQWPFLSQWPFQPKFNHVFCNVHIPFLFVVISHIPGTTMSFFYFEPFCTICFCCISYVQSNDQHWVFTTFWVHSKALCIFNFPPNHYY